MIIPITRLEALRLLAFHAIDSGMIGSFPCNKREKYLYKIHNKEEKKKQEIDPEYIPTVWFRKGEEPIKQSRKEINERSDAFIKQMRSERPVDFDFMKEVDSFDPVANFKKNCEAIVKKSNA